MYKVLKLRKGTTAQNTAFTGVEGELVYDTQLKQIRVHDGSTVGGKLVGIEYQVATQDADGLMSSADKTKLDGVDLSTKQDVISDLDTIRSGAALGATSIQSHQDISGKQDASTAVTHSASTAVGSATNPVYVGSDGAATPTTYTLEKSVPSDAVFTDTVYTHPTTSGNKHIPSGGSSGQILAWTDDGTAVWQTPASGVPTYVGTSTANGSIRVDASSGIVGVVYNNCLYAGVSIGKSNLSSFTINGVTWTVPNISTFSTVCKASGLGRTIGQTLSAFIATSSGCVNCSNGHVYLYDGYTDTGTDDSYGVVAYRTL